MCEYLTKDATNEMVLYSEESFGTIRIFYLTVNIYKGPLSTHLVCSDCVSLVNPLGIWLDQVLQPDIASQPFYLKDSFTLKQDIDKLVVPPNVSIITFDIIVRISTIFYSD
jgi:hypothetical protein